MKKLLLITLLFPLITWGQNFVPIKQYDERNTHFHIDSSFSYPTQYQEMPTYDTIPVIMLVCDTADRYSKYWNDSTKNHFVYWQKGYEIKVFCQKHPLTKQSK